MAAKANGPAYERKWLHKTVSWGEGIMQARGVVTRVHQVLAAARTKVLALLVLRDDGFLVGVTDRERTLRIEEVTP